MGRAKELKYENFKYGQMYLNFMKLDEIAQIKKSQLLNYSNQVTY